MGLRVFESGVILAQAAPVPPATGGGGEKQVEFLSNDVAILLAIGLGALLVLAFFARQAFGKPGRRRKRVSESRSVPDASSLPKIEMPIENKERRKHRRRRRSHRPSNRTLGETGGLPPRREGVDS